MRCEGRGCEKKRVIQRDRHLLSDQTDNTDKIVRIWSQSLTLPFHVLRKAWVRALFSIRIEAIGHIDLLKGLPRDNRSFIFWWGRVSLCRLRLAVLRLPLRGWIANPTWTPPDGGFDNTVVASLRYGVYPVRLIISRHNRNLALLKSQLSKVIDGVATDVPEENTD